MRVYHFINEEYGLQSLERRRLKISRITETNDPFEFSSLDLSDASTRETWKAVRVYDADNLVTQSATHLTQGELCSILSEDPKHKLGLR